MDNTICDHSRYEDLLKLICGRKLGDGASREVFIYDPDPSLVIKIASTSPRQNYIEWEIWQYISNGFQFREIQKWFTPCIAISQCGMFLLQKRIETKPMRDYPKKIPWFFTDTKYTNYGWLKGRFVCCDYGGFGNIFMNGKINTKMKKANWYDNRYGEIKW